MNLYLDQYCDTNFTHFSEIVYEDFNIKVSDTTINKWLRDEDTLSPKAKRKTKKIMKKGIKAKITKY